MKKLKFFEELHRDYSVMIKVKNYRTGGGRMYINCTFEFLEFLELNQIISIQDVKGSILKSYYEYILARPSRLGGTLSQSTINHHLFALKLLFQYLCDTGEIIEQIAIPNYLSRQNQTKEHLTIEEINLLFRHCSTQRDTALLSIAYGCGLRRSEIEDLNTKDLHFTEGYLIVREGKNSKRREVPMSDSVIEKCRSYYFNERLGAQQNCSIYQEAFFLNNTGQRMSGQAMNRSLKKLVLEANNAEIQKKKVSLHTMRHSIATHLSENGVEIEIIKKFLGHSLIDTAQLYAIRQLKKTQIKL
jgi:site-specific recombinase XerD